MKKKTKRIISSIAISLALILFFQMIPAQTMKVLANAIGGIFETTADDNAQKIELNETYYDDSKNIGNATILYEDESKRTLNSKEYAMSDGTIMVRQYSTPVHYLDGSGYKEIEANSELQKESAKQRLLQSVKVNSSGKVESNASELQIGKNGTETSDVFLNLELPEVPSYYHVIGARITMPYQTYSAEKQKITGEEYKVYVVEPTNDLLAVTQESKPQLKQDLGTLAQTVKGQKGKVYQSNIINAENLQSDVLTIGVMTDETAPEEAYAVLSTVEVEYFYQEVIGIKDGYSMETVEINGAQAMVNARTGYATAVIDLASVNTLSDMPFSISLVHNDYYDEVLSGIRKPSLAGNNLKLSVQQYIRLPDNLRNEYEMIDASGAVSKFEPISGTCLYNREKKLYSTFIAVNAAGKREIRVFDTLGNTMLFEDGRLTKIYTENNPNEYINVNYVSGTEKISQVAYYNDNVCKYTIVFTYDANNRICNVETKTGSVVLAQKSLEYDSYGNLVSITDHGNGTETGIETITLGYCTGVTSDERTLNSIYNNQRQGVIILRDTNQKVEKLQQNAGTLDASTARTEQVTTFTYYGARTKIDITQNGILQESKNVSFNNVGKVISEWQENSNGIVTVQSTNAWGLGQNETNNYTDETYGYYYEEDEIETTLWENDIITKEVNSGMLGLTEDVNLKYGITFKIELLNTEIVYQTGLDVLVQINGKNLANIFLSQGGTTYVCVPCGFYSNNATVKIKNRGVNPIDVKHVKYSVLDFVAESYTYGVTDQTHKLSSVSAKLSAGQISTTSYDENQRVQTVFSAESTSAINKETLYEYNDTSTNFYEKGKLKSAKTYVAGNPEKVLETTEYTYQLVGNVYTETEVTKVEIKNAAATENNTETEQKQYYKTKNVTKKTTIGGGVSQEIIVAQTDTEEVTMTSYYKLIAGDLRLWKVESLGRREEYTHNRFGQITEIRVYEGTDSNAVYIQINHYDSNGTYLGSDYGNSNFRYEYDGSGYVTGIGYLNQNNQRSNYVTYEYYADNMGISANQLYSKTYANGNVENYTYTQTPTGLKTVVQHRNNASGNVVGRYEYYYNTHGAITGQAYYAGNNLQLHYDYGDLSDKQQQVLSISGLKHYMEYTTVRNATIGKTTHAKIESYEGCHDTEIMNIYYDYDEESRLAKMEYKNHNVTYGYDEMERFSSKTTSNYYGTLTIQQETYLYEVTQEANNEKSTTSRLACIDDKTYYNNDRTSTYENGMLKSITYNGSTYTYEYDGFGRLTKETSGNTVIGAYSYDGQNNVQDGTLTYDSNGQLIRVDGLGIMYDALGNPTIYKGVYLTWGQGRKLLGGQTTDGKTYTYSYDGNGMRYRKKIGNSVTDYYYSGTQLLMESRDGQRIYYVYGQTGIEAMILSGSNANNVFYFDKNTLGDIVAIRNKQGVIVAEYEYDAWGRILYQSGEMAEINPFRYRGYYYDTETGFYYLQTRYYDPEAMRFINADNYELVAELAQSYELNLYAYCANNPVMFTDETGEGLLAAVLIGAAIGVAAGATTYAAGQVFSFLLTGEWSWSWGDFIGSVVGGAIGGAISPFLPNASGFIGDVVSTASGMLFENALGEENHSWLDILTSSIGSLVTYGVFHQKGMGIDGITRGRNSYSAISKQIKTKLKNKTIKKVKFKTLAKMYVADIGDSLPSASCGSLWGTIK